MAEPGALVRGSLAADVLVQAAVLFANLPEGEIELDGPLDWSINASGALLVRHGDAVYTGTNGAAWRHRTEGPHDTFTGFRRGDVIAELCWSSVDPSAETVRP